MADARRFLRDLTPPVVARAIAGRNPAATRLLDGYRSWEEASTAAGAYSETAILDRVRSATNAVLAGEAAFERDGVLFDTVEYRWQVVAALMLQSARDGGHLRVLDFGGALGSTYWQYRTLLDGLDVRWGVVEQPTFVEAGSAYENDVLSFHDTIEACAAAVQPNVILLSSVLQYLPDPHGVLRQLGQTSARTLVIDRTPQVTGAEDIPVVQVVPPTIYEASYPAWLLSTSGLIADLPGWTLIGTFAGLEPTMRTTSGIETDWLGMTFTRS